LAQRTLTTSDKRLVTIHEAQLTKRILPPCSVAGCDHAAGAVIRETLYCGWHAVYHLQQIRGASVPLPTKPQPSAG